jgi:hypothetical protein
LHGQADDDAHFPPPQFVAREAAVRIAPGTTVAIADALADRLLMQFAGFQN